MTRREQIEYAATKLRNEGGGPERCVECPTYLWAGFVSGAEWADANPESVNLKITSKGFKWEMCENGSWKDLSTGLVWLPKEEGKHTHQEAIEKFKDSLPTIEEFELAEDHGIREVLDDFKDYWFWSASLYPVFSDFARVFNGGSGGSYDDYRDYDNSVRCVGR